MPRPRFLRLPAEKRERILHIAARRFGEQGYRSASLNQILEEAEISKGAAYYYFDGKADLFGATVEHFFADALEEVGLALQGLDRRRYWPRIRELQQRWLERAKQEPWMSGLSKEIWRLFDEERRHPELRAALERFRSWLRALIEHGQELGAVRVDLPSQLLTDLVAGVDAASDRWMAENWDRLTPAQLESIAEALFEALRRLLEPPRRRA